MANIAHIRTLLQTGKATIGSWVQIPSSHVAEIVAKGGYDWVAVDMEHGSLGVSDLPDLLRAIRAGGACPLVRVAEATKTSIKGALDAGAQGLIFPMIESRAQLDAAIAWALYPSPHRQTSYPTGQRGVGYACANGFGQDFTRYTQTTAQDILLVAQIEHIAALHALEDIVSHTRLDAIMVGPYDLSASLGCTGHWEHADFIAAMHTLCHICRTHAMPIGIHIVHPDPAVLAQRVAEGYTFIAYGTDGVFLYQAAARPHHTACHTATGLA